MTTTEQSRGERPVFLKVLCILSFIVIGINVLQLLFGLITGAPTTAEIQANETEMQKLIDMLREDNLNGPAEMYERFIPVITYTAEKYWTMYVANLVTIITGFFGVLYMWQGKKLGFHLYIIYNIASVVTIYLAVPAELVPGIIIITGVVISTVFILLYARNLKWMH